MKILIATGIYPPDIGGPAQYAKNLKEEFEKKGHKVLVRTYRFERKLPSGISHIFYFAKLLLSLRGVDLIIALDTFSVALPATIASKLLKKKMIIRTGGDFLWESYVERTGDLVLLRKFYETRKANFSPKEKKIYFLTNFIFKNASGIVFSTFWQKRIFESGYLLVGKKIEIIENYYGPKLSLFFEPNERVFVGGTRPLKWKNRERLNSAFLAAKAERPDIILDFENAPFDIFMGKIQHSYAVILASLGDISPNMILDAIRAEKPFILTRETGLVERLQDIAIFVDPEDERDIKEKILFLSDENNYRLQREKIRAFAFTHSYEEIVSEFLAFYEKL